MLKLHIITVVESYIQCSVCRYDCIFYSELINLVSVEDLPDALIAKKIMIVNVQLNF